MGISKLVVLAVTLAIFGAMSGSFLRTGEMPGLHLHVKQR